MGSKDRKPRDFRGSYIQWWHAAMGHPGDATAIRMIEQGLGKINGVEITKKMYNRHAPWCEACAKGKCRRNSHKARENASEGWPDRPNMIHSFDSTGKMLRSMWGHRYSTIIKDHHDGRPWAYAHSKKTGDVWRRLLAHHEHAAMIDGRLSKTFHQHGGIHDLKVMAYRCDNETNFPEELERRRSKGIGSEFTVPRDGHGQQNAVAERAIGQTRQLADILINSKMHSIPPRQARRLWPYAYRHAAHLQLLWPTRHNEGNASPGEKRYAAGKGSNNKKWRARLLHIWGSKMIARTDDSKFRKGECKLRGHAVYFLGVPEGFGPGYLGWDKNVPTKHPKVYYNVSFQEDAGENSTDGEDAPECLESADSDTEADDSEAVDGGDTIDDVADIDMGPAQELSSASDIVLLSDSSDSEAEADKEENTSKRHDGPTRLVENDAGGNIALWSSADDSASDSCDGDVEDVGEPWEARETGHPTEARRPRRAKISAKKQRAPKKKKRRKLEVLQSDRDLDDDWAARLYIYKPRRGKSPTYRALWRTLKDDYGMQEQLEEFLQHNGQHDASSRPLVFEPSDGSRRWVWVPTSLADQAVLESEEDDVPDVVDAGANRKPEAEEESKSSPGESIRPGLNQEPSEPSGEDSSGPDASCSEEGDAPSRAEETKENPRDHGGANATERGYAALFYAEQRVNRRERGKWYDDLCKSDPRVDTHLGTPEHVERRFERATSLLGRVAKMARQSIKARSKQGRRLVRRARSVFTMASCLVLVSVAQMAKGLEGVKQRDVPEPRNYKDVVNSEFAEFWNEAIQAELANLKSHEIWEFVDLPPGRKCIDTTWRFRCKPTKTGLIDKFKARLCARGFRQIHGFDFTETHAPVTVLSAWRANVAECANYGHSYDLWDISAAYLTAELLEDIYCLPPEGMEIPEGMENKVLKLKKALYGLKQAGRAWNKKLTKWLTEYGFGVSTSDPSLFMMKRVIDDYEHTIRLNVHVDDAFAMYTSEQWYQEFKTELQQEFDLSSSADSDVFLGITIDRLRDGAIKISQQRYVDDIVASFLGDGDKVSKVPYVVSWKLSKDMGPQTTKEKKAMEEIPYRRLIGMLLHLANCTRPDISAAVGILGKFNANPGMKHWKAALEVVKYLKGTANYGVVYGRQRDGIPYVPLCGYSDASWADDPDDRTSRAGTMLWSWGGPIEWRSFRQKSQALSSCEAEYMAASSCTQSVVWASRLFKEFGYEDLGIFGSSEAATEQEMEGHRPVVIYEDNSGCIEWSKNPVDHQRAKHIDLRYHYVRAKVRAGEVKLVHCPTDEMMADLLTKYLSAPRFAYLRDKMLAME